MTSTVINIGKIAIFSREVIGAGIKNIICFTRCHNDGNYFFVFVFGSGFRVLVFKKCMDGTADAIRFLRKKRSRELTIAMLKNKRKLVLYLNFFVFAYIIKIYLKINKLNFNHYRDQISYKTNKVNYLKKLPLQQIIKRYYSKLTATQNIDNAKNDVNKSRKKSYVSNIKISKYGMDKDNYEKYKKEVLNNAKYHVSKNDFINHQVLEIMTDKIKEKFGKNEIQPKDKKSWLRIFINIPNNITEVELADSIRKNITIAINQTFVDFPHEYYKEYTFDIDCKLTYDKNDVSFTRRNYSKFILNKIAPDIRFGLQELSKLINDNKNIFKKAYESLTPTPEQQVLNQLTITYENSFAGKTDIDFSPMSLLPFLDEQNFPWYEYHIRHICDQIAKYHVRRPSKLNVSVQHLQPKDLPNAPFRRECDRGKYRGRYVYVNISRNELMSRLGLTPQHTCPEYDPYYDAIVIRTKKIKDIKESIESKNNNDDTSQVILNKDNSNNTNNNDKPSTPEHAT